MNRAWIYTQIDAERERQEAKHGRASMRASERLCVLTEEVGEVAKALNDAESDVQLRGELVQVSACAVAWIEYLDRLARAATKEPEHA